MICNKYSLAALTVPMVLMFTLRPLPANAQDYKRIAPSLPQKTEPPLEKETQASLPSSGQGVDANASTSALIPALKGLVFVGGPQQIVAAGLPLSRVGSSGISVSLCPELEDDHFTAQLTAFIGRPVTVPDLDRIKAHTTTFLQTHQHPFVDVSVPPQNVASGIIQVLVTEYKLGKIHVTGARYFSPSLIRSSSGLTPEQNLRSDDLQANLDRLNRNPFLNVNAVFKPGAQTGETDVTLDAKDQIPVRVYSGYDNLGVCSLGTEEYNFGANWGNVFGTGQILSYQFTRTISGRSTSHSISDTIPLHWGDELLIFGSYGQQRPLVAAVFDDTGHSGQASIRYVHPLLHRRRITQDVQIGYGFKTTDNNLEFAGLQVFAAQAEVDQFSLTYDSNVSDPLGQTAIQNMFVFSPGHLTPGNTSAAVSSLVPGAKPYYRYDRFSITRTTPLFKALSAITRLSFQVSDHNLPYSEQVGGGGVGSVRGYYTDTALGSEGQMVSQELRLPAFSLSSLFNPGSEGSDKAQFGAFFDYASLRQVSGIPDVKNRVNLASTGVLARYSVSRYIDAQFDLGWRLGETPTVPQRGANGQTSVTANF